MNSIINGASFTLSVGGQNDIESLTPEFSYLNGRRFKLIDSNGTPHLLKFNDLIEAALAEKTTFNPGEDSANPGEHSAKICAALLSLKDKGYPHEGPVLMTWVISLKRFFGNFCQKDLLAKFSKKFSLIERNQKTSQNLIDNFDAKDHTFLQNLFPQVNLGRDEWSITIEMLSFFLPDQSESLEPTKLSDAHINAIESFMALEGENRLARLLPKQADKNSSIRVRRKFLDAIKVICPTPNSMTLDQRAELIKAMFHSIKSGRADYLTELDSEAIKKCLSENEELANNYRNSYSRLIDYHSPESIAKIFQEIFGETVEVEEREELIVTLMEQFKIHDAFSNPCYFSGISPIESLKQLPRGERQDLMKLANRWFEEDPEYIQDYREGRFKISDISWDSIRPFYKYRAFLLKALVPIPQADRAACELELRTLQKCWIFPIGNKNPSMIAAWLWHIAPEEKLSVLRTIGRLLELSGKNDRFPRRVRKILKACKCLYENRQFWMIDLMLDFLKPTGPNTLKVALKEIKKLARKCSVKPEEFKSLRTRLEANLFSPESNFTQCRDNMLESSPRHATDFIREKLAIVESLLTAIGLSSSCLAATEDSLPGGIGKINAVLDDLKPIPLLVASNYEAWLVKAFDLLLSSKTEVKNSFFSDGVRLVSSFGTNVNYDDGVFDTIELLYPQNVMGNFKCYLWGDKLRMTKALHSFPEKKREGIVATLKTALVLNNAAMYVQQIVKMMLLAADLVDSTALPRDIVAEILLDAVRSPKTGTSSPSPDGAAIMGE